MGKIEPCLATLNAALREPVEKIDWDALAMRNALRAKAKIKELRTQGLYCLDQPIQRSNNAKSLQRVQGTL